MIGYYRHPSLHGDQLAFVSEDDIWLADLADPDAPASRLTSEGAPSGRPAFSPDGRRLAYSSRVDGPSEVQLLELESGRTRALTQLGGEGQVVGWTPGGEVIFRSSHDQPFARVWLWSVDPAGGDPRRLPFGPAASGSWRADGALAIARHTEGLARWKRYRGGRAGAIWLREPDGGWQRLLADHPGNLAQPLWVELEGEPRLLLLSDHEGTGNLYLLEGERLRRLTDHDDFCVRRPTHHAGVVVYAAGASLWRIELPAALAGEPPRELPLRLASTRPALRRRYVQARDELEGYDVAPEGAHSLVIARGKPFVFGHWEGPVDQLGERYGARYRLGRFLPYRPPVTDDEQDPHPVPTLVSVLDTPAADAPAAGEGEERLALFCLDGATEQGQQPLRELALGPLGIGRPRAIEACPSAPLIALIDHRLSVWIVDYEDGEARRIDASECGRPGELTWSPCGGWLAYTMPVADRVSAIKCWQRARPERPPVELTAGDYQDESPSWDPDGRFLAFVSYRVFDPVDDTQQFDMGFPRGGRICLLTLREDQPSPLEPVLRPPGAKLPGAPPAQGKPLAIDLEGAADRVVRLPGREARYRRVHALPGNKLLLLIDPLEGALTRVTWRHKQPVANRILEQVDLETLDREQLAGNMTSLRLSADRRTMILRAGNKLRVLKAGDKPDRKGGEIKPSRRNGWLGLARLRLEIDPAPEWRQMLREAWRLQREQFWREDMSEVDWPAIWRRYAPLLARVGCRSELSDLIWEMQGELGTSHAYESGGDLPGAPRVRPGRLGADLELDEEGRYRLSRIYRDDASTPGLIAPLGKPGQRLREGALLLAIEGQPVDRERSPHGPLAGRAGAMLRLTVADGPESEPRQLAVRTLGVDRPLRYAGWVREQRARVHEASDGRVGYVHVPNMGPAGFAEFHRGLQRELEREGLIVDVRHNGGGRVSPLLLDRLARRQRGWRVRRWGRLRRYPSESAPDAMVALGDANSASDGDIFCAGFRQLGLGPIVGERTWGGVIGISPQHKLVDGTVVTQPEYALWMPGEGWGLENRGCEPDHPVPRSPEDYAAGRDPQLARAIELVLAAMSDPEPPPLAERPSRRPPPLPPRGA